MSSPPTPTPNPLIDLPEILLLCREKENIVAFQDALRKHWPAITFFSPSSSTTTSPQPTQQAEQKLKIIPLNERLNTVPHTQPFDLVVSPANSYGRLDGAFDDAISRTFCLPDHPYLTLTRAAQKTLYERWRGYAPPGTCTLVPFPEEIVKAGKALGGCRWVALCPTMRMPENVVWDREVVYKCVWSLMGEVEKWNREVREEGGGGEEGGKEARRRRIDRILMPPLAVGVGKVSKERWAGQAVLAMKHFVDALERPERWGRLDWEELGKDSFEVETTWKPEERRK
ncbi:conserved hypothetical protein [Histoplasma capsulatum var. duboisii H88]|uniref:Macro domain-like protein n=1 Tax=Ajellomyces capsulatus (strain H88) TaxID=544711 RepID=F0URC4_AJEC8|nr:conserved hypothetical protein [Histoplasma capsulatum var. duboisii H88]